MLYDATLQNLLHLCNIPDLPTRIGNSISRDTTPDLTFTYNIKNAIWTRLDETLGSDHHIIQLLIAHQRHAHQRIGTARITNWIDFRNDTPADSITNLDEWAQQLLDAAKKHTKEIALSEETPVTDAHLLHLWDARHGLLRRWKRNKSNKKLRIRIAQITAEAHSYAKQLSQQNWTQVCNQLQGTLGNRRTWHLLRSLLGSKESKSTTQHHLKRLMHNYQGTESDLLREIQQPLEAHTATSSQPLPSYTGKPNPDMDAPFTMAEIEAAVHHLTRNTAPGKDRIPNKLLRNLDYVALEKLLEFFNSNWQKEPSPHNGSTPKLPSSPNLTNHSLQTTSN